MCTFPVLADNHFAVSFSIVYSGTARGRAMSATSSAYPEIPAASTEQPGTEVAADAIKKLIQNLGHRKELYSLRYATRPGNLPAVSGFNPSAHSGWKLSLPGMQLHGAQIFIRNLFNPDTPFKRLLIDWQTGTGKTIAVVSISKEYVRLFRQQLSVEPERRPSVFIIGFTKTIIMNDMLKYPELGYVSFEEAEELRRLKMASEAAGPASQEARHLGGFLGVLRRRITDRSRGGYYQFYGYKEFANKLFIVTRKGADAGFDVQSLYERSLKTDSVEVPFSERLISEVRNGNMTVNEDLLDSLRGGLLVADEIHNVYNMQSKNNYGVAIQYVLDVLGEDAPRAVFMSATPMTGSAAEVVDLLNLLIPPENLPGGVHLRRQDFFVARERRAADRRSSPEVSKTTQDGPSPADDDESEIDLGPVSQLLPGALERIGHLSAGRVSFLLDTDTASYPRRIFVGEPVEAIPYLMFTSCAMSPFHQRTFDVAMSKSVGGVGLPANAHSLYDMAFPNPEYPPSAAADDPKSIGLYESGETMTKLAAASAAWRDAAGVVVLKGAEAGVSPGTSVVSGPFLEDPQGAAALAPEKKMTRPGVSAYSGKYTELIRQVVNFVRSRPGKIMIYHHRVRMAGVLLIQELLRMNGFADEFSNPTDNTICSICGVPRGKHGEEESAAPKSHEYAAARFVVAHSDVDKAVMERSISKYNSSTNVHGYQFRILAGSKIIREGYPFRAVRKQYVTSLPTDIPTLIQVFGRVVRKDSHSELAESERNVEISILVSVPAAGEGPAQRGLELSRYADKMKEYLVIQQVGKELRRHAVDGFASYGRLLSADPTLADRPTLDSLPYRPVVELGEIRPPLTVSTFEAYGHGEREVKTIVAVLRVLFSERPVWKYEDLWAAVRSGVVRGVGYDSSLFSEGNFALALREMKRPYGSSPVAVAYAPPFYVLCPVGPGGRAILDVETYHTVRALPTTESGCQSRVRVKVSDFLQKSHHDRRFDVKLRSFVARFLGDGETNLDLSLVEVEGSFHTALMRKMVEEVHRVGENKITLLGSSEKTTSVMNMYRRFKILVTAKTLLSHDAAVKVYKGGKEFLRKLVGDTPVGYMGRKSVEIYTPEKDEWQEIPHASVGIGRRQAENDIVIGFVVDEGADQSRGPSVPALAKFKIRPPIQALKSQRKTTPGKTDIRSLVRGAVCETRPREELNTLVARLLKVADIAADVTRSALIKKLPSAADLCTKIKKLLLNLEESVRNSPEGMLDGIRWLYLSMDRSPSVSVAAR